MAASPTVVAEPNPVAVAAGTGKGSGGGGARHRVSGGDTPRPETGELGWRRGAQTVGRGGRKEEGWLDKVYLNRCT